MSITESVCERVPNALEASAIRLHDHMWENISPNSSAHDEGLLDITGDDDVLDRMIRLLNELQDEIKASGIAHRNYSR